MSMILFDIFHGNYNVISYANENRAFYAVMTSPKHGPLRIARITAWLTVEDGERGVVEILPVCNGAPIAGDVCIITPSKQARWYSRSFGSPLAIVRSLDDVPESLKPDFAGIWTIYNEHVKREANT